MDETEYRWAVREACVLGIDPTKLEHIFREPEWRDPSLYWPQIAIDALSKKNSTALKTPTCEEEQLDTELTSLRSAIDAGDTSGLVEGNVFTRVRMSLNLPVQPH